MTTAREDTVRLAGLLQCEHDAMADFLVALSVFDRDRRWVELGYSSLFYFLARELGLPKGPAYYRKTAAELIQKYPDIVEPLRDGRLNLSTIVEVSNVITPENRAEVLPRFFGTSKREAREVVAEIKPTPAAPRRTIVTTVRPVAPAAAGSAGSLRLTGSAVLLEEPNACQVSVPDEVCQAPSRPERSTVEPLTAELTRLHVTVTRRLLDKLARARDALSHSHPGASDDVILEVGLDLVIQRFLKRRGIGAKPRKKAAASTEANASAPPAPPPSGGRSRYVPPEVWRAVWERGGGCCAWPLENGGVCGSTYKLELDHREEFALGAGTTADETRIVCRPPEVSPELGGESRARSIC